MAVAAMAADPLEVEVEEHLAEVLAVGMAATAICLEVAAAAEAAAAEAAHSVVAVAVRNKSKTLQRKSPESTPRHHIGMVSSHHTSGSCNAADRPLVRSTAHIRRCRLGCLARLECGCARRQQRIPDTPEQTEVVAAGSRSDRPPARISLRRCPTHTPSGRRRCGPCSAPGTSLPSPTAHSWCCRLGCLPRWGSDC